MFFKDDFANIIKKISNKYDNQRDFAIKSGINRNYLSRYMNLKMDKPPKPSILLKLANASKGITTYAELMEICGYINIEDTTISVDEKISLLKNLQNEAVDFKKLVGNTKEMLYMQYSAKDSSMAPLLDIGDKALIFKKSSYKSGETILFSLDEQEYIRKIVDNGEYVEFHAMNPYYPIIKKTKKELEDQHFAVIGKVIKVENSSAFK